MNDQTFEITCPACNSVVPADARGCPTCAATRAGAAAASGPASAASGAAWTTREEVAKMPLKDYHRLVRDNHRSIEGGAASLPGGTFRGRVVAYTPGVLLVLGVLAGAAKALQAL
jgi:hypothetical protein